LHGLIDGRGGASGRRRKNVVLASAVFAAGLGVTMPAFAAQGQGAAGDAPGMAGAQGLDPGIRKMIETAIAKGDKATIESVLAVARQAAPEAAEEIDRHELTWRGQAAVTSAVVAQIRRAELRSASVVENWNGEVEAGASRSTGSTSNFGLLGSFDLKREGEEWVHRLTARAEVQSTNDETTTERVIAAWQPSYRFDDKVYAFGLAQYEHDPFAGYDHRYTLGGGLGWRAFTGDRFKLELEGGPTWRQVYEVDGVTRSSLAGRGSLNLDWRLTPTLSLTQKTAVYLEGDDGSVVANTALDTKLIGNLKARFSYNVQYERNPPIGTAALNTQSRATFVYGF
jgi:putative salt-induced outer membrane protein